MRKEQGPIFVRRITELAVKGALYGFMGLLALASTAVVLTVAKRKETLASTPQTRIPADTSKMQVTTRYGSVTANRSPHR